MKRIANTLPLLALTALLLPACSFSMSAGSGTKNPNPGSKANGGAAPTKSQPKKMTKSDDGGRSQDVSDDGSDASGGSDDSTDAGSSEGTGQTPPKGESKPTTKSVSVGAVDGGNSGSSTLTARPDSGEAAGAGSGDSSGATLRDKPDAPGNPGARVKSPN